MKRFEVIERIMEVVSDELVVCNLGHPAQELFAIKDRPQNFYMLGSMGLASSIGLGLAMSQGKKVIVIDGDGSVLMNLGSLATIGACKPRNYVLVVIDNESYGSTGFQDSFTARGIRLEEIARACTIEKSRRLEGVDKVRQGLKEALSSDEGPFCLVVAAEKGLSKPVSVIPCDARTIKERFMRSL